MKCMKRFNRTGMILSMVIGMIIVACGSPAAGPQVVESDEPTAPAMQEEMQSTLSIVQERGKLVCIGNALLPGFGFLDSEGNFSGFDVDYCRAIAAAIFGDANALEVRPASARERFTILSSGEGDVIIRNTTWTMSRDTDLGMNFGPTTFYDGQGLMVRKESGVSTLADLQGASVCVVTGTTTELNLADQFAAAGVGYEAVVFEDFDQSFNAYDEGRCDAVTTDKSGLVSRQTVLAVPEDHVILDVTLSKEPARAGRPPRRRPVVRPGELGRQRHAQQTYTASSRYPESYRDLALVVDADVPAARIQGIINRHALVVGSTPFDVYTGEGVAKGRKSVAFRVVFQSDRSTLTSGQVDRFQGDIMRQLRRELNAELRG